MVLSTAYTTLGLQSHKNKEAESPDKHWTFSFFSAGDERIEHDQTLILPQIYCICGHAGLLCVVI